MDGGGGFWDWSEELSFLKQAQTAAQALYVSSGSAHNTLSVSVQIDQSVEQDSRVIDLTSDPSCWKADDSHLTLEHLGTLASEQSGQVASDLVIGNLIGEAHGCSSDTIAVGEPDELGKGSAPDWQRDELGAPDWQRKLAHCEAAFREPGFEPARGGVRHEEESPYPIDLSSTDSSEPSEEVATQPQDVAPSLEDGDCGNDRVLGVDREGCDDRVWADGRVSRASASQDSEAQSLNLSVMEDIRVRLDFGCLETDCCKDDASVDDASPAVSAGECSESADATRGQNFVIPFPLGLPLSITFLSLRAVGLLGHPLRHVPKIALILLSLPAPRPQQIGLKKEVAGVLPQVYRRRRRSMQGTRRGHFTRKHSLLDLTAADWLRDDRGPDRIDYPSDRSSSAECDEEPSESSSSCGQAEDHSEQLDGADGPGILRADGADGGDPVMSAHGLLVSADTLADSSFSPQRKAERSRPSQLEVMQAAPLTRVHSQRWESDSFLLECSPSSLSLDGGFGFRGVDGSAEVSPMSSRSSSSSDLGEGEMQSDTGSSTDESDSHLYLPSNHLLFTPPPTMAAAEPPVKPLSEVSRQFVLPPGVTDPAEMEDLEQQWADQLRARRGEHADQHYMSAAELMSPPWSNLVFWHGSDKKGQPVLYCKLGLAVRTLPRRMQDRMGCALYSMVELAENSLWRPECGWGFQRMTVVVDAEGLGITRMAPVEALKHGFKLIHRDYPGFKQELRSFGTQDAVIAARFSKVFDALKGFEPSDIANASRNEAVNYVEDDAARHSPARPFLSAARQGYTYIINVPPLLNMMIGVFKRVIGYDEKEANERLGVYGRNYRPHLQKDFEPDMLHVDYGGSCPCCSDREDKETVASAGLRPADAGPARKRRGRPEDWVLDFVPSYQR